MFSISFRLISKTEGAIQDGRVEGPWAHLPSWAHQETQLTAELRSIKKTGRIAQDYLSATQSHPLWFLTRLYTPPLFFACTPSPPPTLAWLQPHSPPCALGLDGSLIFVVMMWGYRTFGLGSSKLERGHPLVVRWGMAIVSESQLAPLLAFKIN